MSIGLLRQKPPGDELCLVQDAAPGKQYLRDVSLSLHAASRDRNRGGLACRRMR